MSTRSRWRIAVAAMLAVLTVVAVGMAATLLVPRPDSTPSNGETPSQLVGPLPAVLPGATPRATPDAGVVAERLTALSTTGVGSIGALVVDGATGATLYRANESALMIPASNAKLLTALAALDAMPPGTRFATRVVSADPGTIVLVGGGDPFLATETKDVYPSRASLTDLARDTAAALTAQGRTSVALAYDDTLFSGPGWLPEWGSTYADEIAPISALMVDEAILADGARDQHAATTASAVFADLLTKAGVTVTKVGPRTAPAGATPVAAVQSMPLELIVQQFLLTSDNQAAEVTLRHLALVTGRAGTFEQGVSAIQERLAARGLWAPGSVLADGSGLARSSRLTPSALIAVIKAALVEPRFRSIIDGLPVAGATGTLARTVRFVATPAWPGRGYVRAKTGTVQAVATLTGYVVTADGAILLFSFLTNGYTTQETAYTWLDTAAATLAACGCRR